ncbi:branched-chain amino acid transporter AzlC [Roseovarius sp. 22II1-1F6A]|nr:branched-chain amino acid transporter AzlC [Roseovarius sp. 22II1-1F6A]
MAFTTTKSAFWEGFRAGAPFLLVVTPFGIVFGVAALDAGLNLAHAMGFSVVVIAGAAQLTALSTMVDQSPFVIVIGAALLVNLRMLMYSASLAPHLGGMPTWQKAVTAFFLTDQVFAISVQRFETLGDESVWRRFMFIMGITTIMAPFWYLGTLIGAMVGQSIPPEFGLDFAVPVCFMSLIGPALRTGPHGMAALTAAISALLLRDLPWNLGLAVASLVGMVVGAEMQRQAERRAASGKGTAA